MIKICKNCGKEFTPYSQVSEKRMDKQLYCSEKCAINYRSKNKFKNFKKEIGDKNFNLLLDISKKQQFVEDVEITGNVCACCGSTINLIEHHISYVPVEKIILCRKCHGFLHLNLLEGKKCQVFQR